MMSDDIVKQLAELAPTISREDGRGTVTGAASEIEYLRTDRDRWKRMFIQMYQENAGVTDEMMWAYRNETGQG